MALVASNQNLIRDITELVKTRGLRLAAHTGNTYPSTGTELISDSFKIYTHITGGSTLAAPAAGIQRIVIDFKTSVLTTMDEKGYGSIHPHVPSPTRP